MSRATIAMTDRLHQYYVSVAAHLNDAMRRLRDETEGMPNGGMQISAEQGQIMAFLIRALNVKKCLEIGVFTGYSSLVVAQALPEDGRIIACDVSEEFTAVARRYWIDAGVDHKIDLRIAPATETLDRLIAEGHAGTFDFAFIDADKPNYDRYYEAVLVLLRQGGVFGIDNTLWGGRVSEPEHQDEDTNAFRALNAKIYADARVDMCLLPVGDGLTLCRKK
ncbi:MAG: class I SAM-dependent methyltransferase [Capsulimonadales bacterium]|nr:class I SAM-dependent methyltransferase [Capsulimonadales bacterium]